MAVFFKRILYFASVALARCGQYQRKQRFHEAKMTASHNAREIEITRETINGAFFLLSATQVFSLWSKLAAQRLVAHY